MLSSKLCNLKHVVDIFHCFPLLPDISSETLRTRRSIRRREMGRNRANRKEAIWVYGLPDVRGHKATEISRGVKRSSDMLIAMRCEQDSLW